jgi:hypothetical protein
MVFIELPLFAKYFALSDSELRELQTRLLQHPEAGDLITHGRGLRKLRIALPGRGKSGGARIIYYWMPDAARCYLVFAYPKNVMENLTDAQLKKLAKAMQEEVGNG